MTPKENVYRVVVRQVDADVTDSGVTTVETPVASFATESMIIVPGGVAPQFEGDYSQPIWSLFAWRPVDDADTDDAYSWSAHEWTDDGDGGEFYEVAARLTHAACERVAHRLGMST